MGPGHNGTINGIKKKKKIRVRVRRPHEAGSVLGDLVLLRQPGDGMFVDPVGIVYVLCPIDGLFSYNGLFTYVCSWTRKWTGLRWTKLESFWGDRVRQIVFQVVGSG